MFWPGGNFTCRLSKQGAARVYKTLQGLLPRLGFPPLGKRKSHLPPREILRIPPQQISHTPPLGCPSALQSHTKCPVTSTTPRYRNTDRSDANLGAKRRAGDPAPAPTARLRRAASGTVPAQRHRPCPDRSHQQDAQAPTAPCFWRKKGVFGQERCSSPIWSICPREGKQGGSQHAGPCGCARKRGAHRHDATLPAAARAAGSSRHSPGFALRQSERQQTQLAGCHLAPVQPLLSVCVEPRSFVSKESAGGARLPQARGCRQRPGTGPHAGTGPRACSCSTEGAAPSTQPHAGEASGPADVRGGWGGISVPASGTGLPPSPHASLQLSPKTEKFVLVLLLLLLSSYEMSPATESLNKSPLLKQHPKSASLQSPSQFQTFNLLRPERKQRLCLFTSHRGAPSTHGLSHLPNRYILGSFSDQP